MSLLGLSLLATAPIVSPSASKSVLLHLLNLKLWGLIFLAIGAAIFYGLKITRHRYQFSRIAIGAATGVAFMWLISLLLNLLANVGSMPIVVLWGYFTWNLFYIVSDPGWTTQEIIRNIKNADR